MLWIAGQRVGSRRSRRSCVRETGVSDRIRACVGKGMVERRGSAYVHVDLTREESARGRVDKEDAVQEVEGGDDE